MLCGLLHLLGIVVGRQISERGVQTNTIVEAVDVAGDGGVGCGLGGVYAGGFLVLERGKEALGDSIMPRGQAARSQQLPLRLMLGTKPCAASVLANSPLAYWLPRSEWKITPGGTGEADHALRNA